MLQVASAPAAWRQRWSGDLGRRAISPSLATMSPKEREPASPRVGLVDWSGLPDRGGRHALVDTGATQAGRGRFPPGPHDGSVPHLPGADGCTSRTTSRAGAGPGLTSLRASRAGEGVAPAKRRRDRPLGPR